MKKIRTKVYVLSLIVLLGISNSRAASHNTSFDSISKNLNAYMEGKKLMLKIPESMLRVDMLFVRDRRGQAYISWEIQDDEVLLRIRDVFSNAGNIISAHQGKNYLFEPKQAGIIKVFPILKQEVNGVVIIDITTLFTKNNLEFLALNNGSVDPERSFLEKIRSYPKRIEIDAVQTITGLNDSTPITIQSHYSIVCLPDTPMNVRFYNSRMGFFPDVGYQSLAEETNPAAIMRWRLDKKNPKAKVSSPISPIVFYLDPQIPKEWIPYIKKGILEWNEAFLAAGFKNAIKLLPPPENDPNWSVADMGYSVIRWSDNRKKRKGQNPRILKHGAGTVNKVVDIRTGEILKSDIIIGPPFAWQRYVIRAAATEPDLTLPVSQKVIGNLIEDLVAHETGHALGLQDGHYGKYAYPAEKLHTKKWLSIYGHTPSIMNYDRTNYMVQPKDSIPMEMRFQKVGPADVHQIKWGYSTFFGVEQPEEELPYLESIIKVQDSIPWLGYVKSGLDNLGPYCYEVISSNDPVYTTTIGMRNLKKSMQWLYRYSKRIDSDSQTLEILYFQLLKQWVNEMQHVTSLIGGYQVEYKKTVYNPIPKEIQQQAFQFLLENAFKTPKWLINKGVTGKFTKNSTLANISSVQSEVLVKLLELFKFQRMCEMELTYNNDTIFTRKEFVKELNKGIWLEVYLESGSIDSYRQELQLTYLLLLKQLLSKKDYVKNATARFREPPFTAVSSSTKAILLASLMDINNRINELPKENLNEMTQGHLLACRQLINQLLKIQ